ncbi:UNVERIFIED_CONTAM: hypothetical protein Sindi_1248900 [Sesamum indicum]
MVAQARLSQRIRANQARAITGATAPTVPSSATSPHPIESSMAPEGSRPRSPPIDVGSEDTRSRTRLQNQPASVSPIRFRSDESSSGGLLTRRRRRGKSPMGPNTRSRSQSLALGQSVSAALEDRRGMEMLSNVSDCWRRAREDLRAPNHLTTVQAGENSSPIGRCLPTVLFLVPNPVKNLGSYTMRPACLATKLPYFRVPLLAWRNMLLTRLSSLSLKCVEFRRNQLVSERKNNDMRIKIGEVTARAESLESQRAVLEARVKELEDKMASEISKATESGKEVGFAAGHSAGKIAGAIEGRAEFLNSDDFAARIREARIQGACDFIKAPAFDTALEIRAADYLVQGFDRCKAQASSLKGFAPDFDIAKFDPSLDGNMQPFPKEAASPQREDEFTVLLDEIENM